MPNNRDGASPEAAADRALNVRVSNEIASEVGVVAEVDGVPIAEIVRRALRAYVATRREDEDFRQRSREALQRHMAILERFAE
jgi:hypothetical protein